MYVYIFVYDSNKIDTYINKKTSLGMRHIIVLFHFQTRGPYKNKEHIITLK